MKQKTERRELDKRCEYSSFLYLRFVVIGSPLADRHHALFTLGRDNERDVSAVWENECLDSGEWTMQWTVDNGQWTVDSGQWRVDNGQWRVDSGQWTMVSGQWTMGNGHWTFNS